jgi:hypothetical protein
LRKNKNLQFEDLLIFPLVFIPGYHYLHKKHKDLVPGITSALQEMENEGLIRKMHEEYEAALME